MNEDDITIETDGLPEGGSESDLEAAESREGAKAAKLKAELERTKEEKQEYLDGWQRAKADYVTLLKRLEEEKDGAYAKGQNKALKAFIPVMDSLARAKAAGELPEGFEAIAKQLEEAARAMNLEQFGAIGERFDPNLHEALGQDETADEASDDTVTAVLETGWKAGGIVLRVARVRVAHFG